MVGHRASRAIPASRMRRASVYLAPRCGLYREGRATLRPHPQRSEDLMTNTARRVSPRTPLALVALGAIALYAVIGAQGSGVPQYRFDPDWPKPLPNKWKLGGITGLAVDKDDNVWVLNRPGDLRDLELRAELNPPTAACCVRPPSMIHIDKNGSVIGSFDASIGHGLDVDSKGFVYIGQDTVRKYDPKTGKQVGMVARVTEPDADSVRGM